MIPKCVDLATSREALNNRVRLLFQVDVCIQIKFIFLKSLTTCHLAGGLVVTLYHCVPEPDSVGLPCLRLLCMKCGLLVDRLSMVPKWSKGTRGLTGFLHESTELQRSSSEKKLWSYPIKLLCFFSVHFKVNPWTHTEMTGAEMHCRQHIKASTVYFKQSHISLYISLYIYIYLSLYIYTHTSLLGVQ